jgi:hypothetical protein
MTGQLLSQNYYGSVAELSSKEAPMPADLDPTDSPERSINKIANSVATRLPGVDRRMVEPLVRETYERLAADSRITEHLAVLVEQDVVQRLRQG